MLYKLIVLVCFAALSTADDCPSSVEEALFRGECINNNNFHFYSFTTLKNSIAKSWMEDINSLEQRITQTLANSTEAGLTRSTEYVDKKIQKLKESFANRTTDSVVVTTQVTQAIAAAQSDIAEYVNEKLSKLPETLIKWRIEQENYISQVLANQTAELYKVAREFNKEIRDLRKSNAVLKEKVDKLQPSANPSGTVETYEPTIPIENHPLQEQASPGSYNSLITTVCKIAEAVGVAIPATCTQLLYSHKIPLPDNLL